jgi:hypothetical protein
MKTGWPLSYTAHLPFSELQELLGIISEENKSNYQVQLAISKFNALISRQYYKEEDARNASDHAQKIQDIISGEKQESKPTSSMLKMLRDMGVEGN